MDQLRRSLLVLMLASGNPATATTPEPAPVREFLEGKGYQTFKLTKLPTGHETVEVTINGVTGIFVLDSGSGATVLHRARLEKFGIIGAGDAQQGSGAGGDVAITSHPIKSLLLNGHPVPLPTVYATNLDSVVNRLKAATGVVVDGVIGQDVLSGFAAIINIGSSELYLKLPKADSPR